MIRWLYRLVLCWVDPIVRVYLLGSCDVEEELDIEFEYRIELYSGLECDLMALEIR